MAMHMIGILCISVLLTLFLLFFVKALVCGTSENKEVRALLIGSSATAGGNAVPRIKADKSAKGNFCGTVSDISTMYKTLIKTNGVHIPKIYSDTDPKQINKKAVLGSIEELFNDTKRKGFILYYSGHGGKYTGNWCFGISLNDIIKLWNNRKKPNPNNQWLFIIADCSFSGAWVNILKNHLKPKDILMQAACRHNEYSVETLEGGIFTLAFKSQLTHLRCVTESTIPAVLSSTTEAIGATIGCVIGGLSALWEYCDSTKSFSPVYYTPFNGDTTYFFLSDDKKKKYWFRMTNSFTYMTFKNCLLTGQSIGSFGQWGINNE